MSVRTPINPLSPVVFAAALAALLGCSPTVKIQAPDKPIEINLNIRIEQEVRVKIDRELDQVFTQNPELFGLPQEKKP
jgi:type IV pilus biogenesis protein CpaD/CtpE